MKSITIPEGLDTIYKEEKKEIPHISYGVALPFNYYTYTQKKEEKATSTGVIKVTTTVTKPSPKERETKIVKSISPENKIPQKSEQKRVKKAEISQHSSSTSTYNTPPKGKEVVEPKEQSKLLQIIKKFIHFFGG